MYNRFSKYVIYAAFGLMAFLSACNGPSNGEADNKATKKWPVNTEMKPHISKAQETLTVFLEKQDTNFSNLAQELEAQNTALIESCTMKGEAHDALHDWLYPHMQLLGKLSQVENYQQAKPIIIQLDSSFTAYHQQFK